MPNKVNGTEHKLVGKNYPTPDLYAKVTGQSKYAEDFRANGMLSCKLLLSTIPRARVKNIDASAALASMYLTRACGMVLSSSLQNSIPLARKSSAYLDWPVTFA